MFDLNGGELEQAIVGLRDTFANNPELLQEPAALIAARTGVSRLAVNVLCSLRMFLDHTDRGLGSDPERQAAFRKRCAELYDEHFAYRFMYRLRNYAQHRQLPIARFELHQADSTGGEAIRTTHVSFDRDTLLEWKGWGTMARDLSAQPAFFAALPLFEELRALVMQLLDGLHAETLGKAAESAQWIRDFATFVWDDDGVPCVVTNFDVLEGSARAEEGRQWRVEPLPVDQIEAVLRSAQGPSPGRGED